MEGTREIAERFTNSQTRMIDCIEEFGEISRSDAVKVFNLYHKMKLFKRCGIDHLNVKHGALLERNVIRNALKDA